MMISKQFLNGHKRASTFTPRRVKPIARAEEDGRVRLELRAGPHDRQVILMSRNDAQRLITHLSLALTEMAE